MQIFRGLKAEKFQFLKELIVISVHELLEVCALIMFFKFIYPLENLCM